MSGSAFLTMLMVIVTLPGQPQKPKKARMILSTHTHTHTHTNACSHVYTRAQKKWSRPESSLDDESMAEDMAGQDGVAGHPSNTSHGVYSDTDDITTPPSSDEGEVVDQPGEPKAGASSCRVCELILRYQLVRLRVMVRVMVRATVSVRVRVSLNLRVRVRVGVKGQGQGHG